MSFAEMKTLMIGVITSWQVIFATIVVIIYLFLVFYVAKAHHKTRTPSVSGEKGKKNKKQVAEAVAPPSEVGGDGDDLGIEE
jgi:phosphotransferase system  glucose/maltose/N-acetylglucosamine-specific IIC component